MGMDARSGDDEPSRCVSGKREVRLSALFEDDGVCADFIACTPINGDTTMILANSTEQDRENRTVLRLLVLWMFWRMGLGQPDRLFRSQPLCV